MSKNKRLIAKIVDGENVIMTIDQNLLSVEFGALDRGNLTDVLDWGIYANRGSISFIDNVGYFNNENINSKKIKSFTAKIYLKNRYHESLIAKFGIESVDFVDETKEVSIELISKVAFLENEYTTESIYPFYSTNIGGLLSSANEKFKTNIGIAEESKAIINGTFIGCPYIGVDSVWNIAKKLCQVTMSRIVETPKGDIQIAYSFPTNRTPIVVKPNNIIGISNNEFAIVENAQIDVTQRERFEDKTLEVASKHFNLSFNDKDELIAIDGLFYEENRTISDVVINGSVEVEIPYKIYTGNAVKEDTITSIRHISGEPGSSLYNTDNYEQKANFLNEDSITITGDSKITADFENLYVLSYTTEGNYSHEYRLESGTIGFSLSTFVDHNTETKSIGSGSKSENIQTNDLLQNISYYKIGDNQINLWEHILTEVKRRYSKGIECFEIECLFNDYYSEDGTKVFSGGDLSRHFEKYDIIIPYVKKRGKVVPLRRNDDGTPKQFRIIGISYSYDGLLKQKLSVQEERYDTD